jgi:hypothetical protein
MLRATVRNHRENNIAQEPPEFIGLRDRRFIKVHVIGDGSREIDGEGRYLSAVRSHRMKRSGGIGIAGAVILDGLIDDADALLLGGVDRQIGVRLNRGSVGDSEKRSELFVRTRRD